MIYMSGSDEDGNEIHILVLEPGNLIKLKEGGPIATPDKKLIVAYTPDIEWLADKLTAATAGGEKLDTEYVAFLIEEGKKREPIVRIGPIADNTKRVL